MKDTTGHPLSVTHLLYLHGFRSSPQSTKARQVAAWVVEHRPDVLWRCPQLPPSPREALEAITAIASPWPVPTTAIIGSSLGGFYASVLAERLGCRAVLLNPAVNPTRDLAAHIGETTAWHSDEQFHFRPEFIDELRAMAPPAITEPARYFPVIAKGDEVLDWREMRARYAACPMKLLEGSDHALSDFAAHWPDIVRFLGWGATVSGLRAAAG